MFVFKSSDRIFGASNLQFLFNVCVIFDKTIKNTILSTKWGCLSPTHSFFLFFGSVVLFPFTAHADPQQGVHSASRFYSLWGRLHSVIYKSTRNYTSASQPFLEFQTYWTSGLFGNGRCNFFKNSSTLKIPLLFFFFRFLFSFKSSLLHSSWEKQKDGNGSCPASAGEGLSWHVCPPVLPRIYIFCRKYLQLHLHI